MFGESVAHATIGRYSASHSHFLDASLLDSLAHLVHQDIDNGLLQRRAEIGLVFLNEIWVLLDGIAQCIEE